MNDILGDDDKPKRQPRAMRGEAVAGALPVASPAEQSAQADVAVEEAVMESLQHDEPEKAVSSADLRASERRARLYKVVDDLIPTYRRGPMRFEDMRRILLILINAL